VDLRLIEPETAEEIKDSRSRTNERVAF
jgi:hypothetical protein